MSRKVQCVADVAGDSDDLFVAFASSDGEMVDEHFGSAAAFHVYRIGTVGGTLVAQQTFGQERRDGNKDKLKPRLAWLVGCDLVYCASISGSASRQLLALEISPLQVAEGPDVADLVALLQQQLAGAPERWLDNILRRKAKRESGFTVDEGEEWVE